MMVFAPYKYRILAAWLFLICLGWLINHTSAQTLKTEYKRPNGDPIQEIWEDKAGYIWGSSETALFRFDGMQWQSIQSPASPLEVKTFAQDQHARLWIGGRGGQIGWVERETFHPFQVPGLELNGSRVSGIAFDKQNRMWLASYGEGLFCLDGNKIHHWETINDIPSKDIYALTIGPDHQIWIGTDQGIAIYSTEEEPELIARIGKEEGLSDPLVTSLTADPHSGIWAGMYDGDIARIKSPTDSPVHQVAVGGSVQQLLFKEDKLWIQTEHIGLLQWDNNASHLTPIVPSSSLLSFLLDQESNLWINESEALYSIPLKIEYSFPQLGNVRCVIPYEDYLWAGTDQGIFKIYPAHDSIAFIYGSDSLHIVSLFQDADGLLWIGTIGKGGWTYDPHSHLLHPILRPNGLMYPHILSMVGTEDEVWLATFGGLFHCSLTKPPQQLQHIEQVDGIDISYTYQVIRDSKGHVWFGTDGKGAGFIDLEGPHLLPALANQSIYSIEEDLSGHIWFSTEDSGLYKSSPDAMQQYKIRTESGLLQVLGMETLSDTSILLLSAEGIGIYFPAQNQYIALGTSWDLPAMGDAFNSMCKTKDGYIWIGTSAGLLSYHPSVTGSRQSPQAVIGSVLVNLQAVSSSTLMDLASDQNHIIIKYSGIWNQAPNKVLFQHRLIGLDQKWENSRNTQAIYPQLNPGSYRFELRLQPAGSSVLSEVQSISFHIAKPIWRQLWFILTLTALSMVILITIVRYREQVLTRRQTLERQAIEYQFETLQNQINPHFLFNSFTTLIGMIEESPRQAVGFVEKLADLFRHVLEYRNKDTIPLWEEKALLMTYVGLLKERFGQGLDLQWEVHSSDMNRTVPPMCLQLLVENACKHNMVSHSSPLVINISIQAEKLQIMNTLQRRKNIPSSTQVGLQNLIDRYRYLCEEEVEIEISSDSYIVRLPLLPSM